MRENGEKKRGKVSRSSAEEKRFPFGKIIFAFYSAVPTAAESG